MKKYVIIALLLFSSTVFAAGFGQDLYMPDSDGGFLTITSEPCEDKAVNDTFDFKSYREDDGKLIPSCWTMIIPPEDAHKNKLIPVIAVYEKGIVSTFSLKLFSTEKKRWTDDENPYVNKFKGDI